MPYHCATAPSYNKREKIALYILQATYDPFDIPTQLILRYTYFRDGMVTFDEKSSMQNLNKIALSESSNVYTGTPCSGWGPGIDTTPSHNTKAI